MKVLIAGDTHGNTAWLHDYLFPVAMTLECEKLVVVGDFGYWEHTDDGVAFLNAVDCLAYDAGIPLYWLHGNHDKHSLALAQYGHQRDAEGFIPVRQNVFYIPQGHSWVWGGKAFRSFGGAYSIDKAYRLRLEQRRYDQLAHQEEHRAFKTKTEPKPVPTQQGTLWFPEEEMTDDEMTDLLAADAYEKDIILSHDKPESARPGWNRKSFPECLPNQTRLQRALRVHKPRYWLHGHLHYHYVNEVADGGPGWNTTVVGLEPDRDAAEDGWRHKNTWAVLELNSGAEPGLVLGADAAYDVQTFQANRVTLY